MTAASDIGTAELTASTDDKLAILYDSVRQPLLSYVVKLMLGQRGVAEDIVQETFMRAWRYLGEHGDVDAVALRPWLFTVARHLAIDVLRARRARPSEVILDDLSRLASADGVDELVQAESVRAALRELSPDHRAVLVELYFHDRSPAEVAERTSVPIGTVRSRTYYAKRALREQLDAQESPHPHRRVLATI